ncbi:hypothetical protein DK26_17960 [Bosea sp. WAO]|uniref:autotransporter outer membrane beta-barrel domain-containing protein n=1 Tax=Bosea sp. WAO TaxID=406341 RepID=UPI0007485B20|nr:autotransporter outer membrane beta-barrel domain-containing protein [Bosea sp. WAO]KUL94759.1 hypothetical protein DK26_17960 [Bosea sp. WAO]
MANRNSRRNCSLAFLLGTTALALPGLAQAQMRWDGSSSNDWNNGDNWSTGLVPAAGSNPIVSGPAPVMPILSGGTTSLGTVFVGYDNALGGAGLTITGGASLTTTSATVGEQSANNAGNARELEAASVTLTGASSWTSTNLQIGAYGAGKTTVNGGSTLTATSNLHLGVHHNSVTGRSGNGTLTVSGTGSQVVSNGTIFVGDLGIGAISVTAGGKITTRSGSLGQAATGSGTVTVHGSGSRWETPSGALTIGNGGSGQFTVSGGATAKTGALNLAGLVNSSGRLTVTGGGSVLEAGQIRLGVRSSGLISVDDGGTLKATAILVGAETTGIGRIDLRGASSLIEASSYTMVGWFGEGRLTVSDGATLRGTVRIAHEASSRGTLNIGAAAGSAAAAAGTVDAATIQFGAGTGKLVFNHTDRPYDFTSSIKGKGSIEHHAGTTRFSGDSSTFTGTTTVSGGTLIVGGVPAGAALGGATTVSGGELFVAHTATVGTVSVLSGGTLGGNGTVGRTTIGNGGTLAPTFLLTLSPRALEVQGNLAFAPGATYRVQFYGGPVLNTHITVTGTASLGGTLAVAEIGGLLYYFNRPQSVLTAHGGISGTFDTVTTTSEPNNGAVTSEVSYTANDVLVTLKPASLVEAVSGTNSGSSSTVTTDTGSTTTPPPSPNPVYNTASGLSLNTWSVAAAIDRAVASGADPSFLYQIYARGDRQSLIAALGTLTGEVHSTVGMMGWEAAGGFLRAMLDPFASGRDPNAMPGAAGAFATAGAYASIGSQAELPSAKGPRIAAQFVPDRLYNLWGQGFGSKSRSGADSARGSQASDTSSGHLALGIDFRVLPDTILGVAIAAGESRSSLSGALGDAKADILQAGLYGMTRIGALSLGASLGYASADVETNRAIPLIGALAIRASYRTEIWSGRAEAAWRFVSFGGLSASPYAAFTAQNLRTPSFVERDGVTGLPTGVAVQGRDGTTARTELGLRLDATTTLFGLSTTAFGKLGWGYYARRDNQFSASLIGLPGSGFGFQGTRPDRNAALIATGLDVRLSNAVSLGARFDAELSQNNQSYAGAATLKVSF